MALHDLFGVAEEAGRACDAERLAREAFAAYPARSARLAVLPTTWSLEPYRSDPACRRIAAAGTLN